MKNYRTGNYNYLRQQNLIGVMHYLYDNAPISRIDLARLSKLNKTTVSSLIEELLENGFVREVGIGQTKAVGRNKILLDINPDHGFIVSGEIGGNFIHVICTDFSAGILWRHKEPIKNGDWREAFEHLIQILRKAVDFAEERGKLLGIALGVHGLFNQETGTLLLAPSSGWRDVPVFSILSENFQTGIFIDNEANLAAFGERFFGAAKGHKDMLYISAGRGLGGGIIINGNIYNGISGIAGEFGHITINPDGILCNCGNKGCWETEVNQTALKRYLSEELKISKSALITKKMLTGEPGVLIEGLMEAGSQNDQPALNALKTVGRKLGIGLASLLNVLNPGLVVFGGELSAASDYLLPEAKIEMKRRALKWTLKDAEIVVARFGSDAAIMGGVGIVFQSILSNLSSLKRISHNIQ